MDIRLPYLADNKHEFVYVQVNNHNVFAAEAKGRGCHLNLR